MCSIRAVEASDDGARDDGGECQVLVGVFELLGKRWTGLIIATLRSGPRRFSGLRRAIDGMSERMLSERLSELGEAGLVERVVHEGPPLAVTYQLTPCGEALRPALEALEDWAGKHLLAMRSPEG